MAWSQILAALLAVAVEKFGPWLAEIIEQLFRKWFPEDETVDVSSPSALGDFLILKLEAKVNTLRLPMRIAARWLIGQARERIWNELFKQGVVSMSVPVPVMAMEAVKLTDDQLAECCM